MTTYNVITHNSCYRGTRPNNNYYYFWLNHQQLLHESIADEGLNHALNNSNDEIEDQTPPPPLMIPELHAKASINDRSHTHLLLLIAACSESMHPALQLQCHNGSPHVFVINF